MNQRQLRSRFRTAALVVCAVLLALLAGCGTEPPPRWPWWTSEDTAAVDRELAVWRPLFNANRSLAGALEQGYRPDLLFADSTSATGETLYKFAHVRSVTFVPTDSGHRNVYQFERANDTLAMTDTFCQVPYYDTMAACQAVFEYDSLWVVGFRPDTQISGSPPETTITFKPSYTALRTFDPPATATKTYGWSATRVLFLQRDTMPDTTYYHLTRTTGASAFVPTSADAPGISRVILSRPGQIDTFFYSARLDGKGLFNLRSIDSLYTVQKGQEIGVVVATSTPADTGADKNRFFLGVAGTRTDITVGARSGQGTFSFSDTGYQHVFVEVLPMSNIAYPAGEYTGTIWAIPVRVIDQ